MDFYYFYSKIYTFVDYLKKHLFFVIGFGVFLIFISLALYINHSFKIESSSDYLRYIDNPSNSDFLENNQSGIYEDIRKALLEKKSLEKKSLSKLTSYNDIFSQYLKFINQMNGKFGDDFDSILESNSSVWKNLFIASKVFYVRFSGEKIDFPFFLNVFAQCKKGNIL